MRYIVITAALAAAFLNASSAILQRRALGKVNPARLFSREFMFEVVRNKLWLGGLVLQILAFVIQAFALKNGSLVVVIPIMTTDLIFLIVFLHFYFKLPVGIKEWASALAICAGLSGFLLAANPRSGHLEADPLYWAITGSIIGAAAGVAMYYIRRSGSSTFRAGIAGVIAGASFALTSAFTKLTVNQLDHGIVYFFTTWEVYALMLTGTISIILMQNAYSAGPLAVSQPAIEVTDPILSGVIGVLLFGDIVNHSLSALAIEAACAVLLIIGVVKLASSQRIHDAGKEGI